jgi:hypothetical protein
LVEKIERREAPTTDQHRHARTNLPGNFRAALKGEDGTTYEVGVQDISADARLLVDGVFENASFVELHMEGLGRINAHVARDFAGGIGVEFDLSGRHKKEMEAELKAFRKTVASGNF